MLHTMTKYTDILSLCVYVSCLSYGLTVYQMPVLCENGKVRIMQTLLHDSCYYYYYLACSANLPEGLYILPSVISSFFTMSNAISVSTGPIFTIFSPNGRFIHSFIHSSGVAVCRWQSFDMPFSLPPALRPRHGPVRNSSLTLGLVLYVYRA